MEKEKRRRRMRGWFIWAREGRTRPGGGRISRRREGGGEREWGEDSNRILPLLGCARGRETAGRGWRRGEGRGARSGRGRSGESGGCDRRLEVEEGADRWAPPVGDPERGGRDWAGPGRRKGAGGSGPTAQQE